MKTTISAIATIAAMGISASAAHAACNVTVTTPISLTNPFTETDCASAATVATQGGQISTVQSDVTTLQGTVVTQGTDIAAIQTGKADVTYVDSQNAAQDDVIATKADTSYVAAPLCKGAHALSLGVRRPGIPRLSANDGWTLARSASMVILKPREGGRSFGGGPFFVRGVEAQSSEAISAYMRTRNSAGCRHRYCANKIASIKANPVSQPVHGLLAAQAAGQRQAHSYALRRCDRQLPCQLPCLSDHVLEPSVQVRWRGQGQNRGYQSAEPRKRLSP
jgi:hypothetical protein